MTVGAARGESKRAFTVCELLASAPSGGGPLPEASRVYGYEPHAQDTASRSDSGSSPETPSTNGTTSRCHRSKFSQRKIAPVDKAVRSGAVCCPLAGLLTPISCTGSVHEIASCTGPFFSHSAFDRLRQNQKCESRAVFDTARLEIDWSGQA